MLDLAHGDAGVELATARHDLREIVNDAVGAARMSAGGAVGVFGEVPPEPVVAVVTGGNIDAAVLAGILAGSSARPA